jgi:hypothetical protein
MTPEKADEWLAELRRLLIAAERVEVEVNNGITQVEEYGRSTYLYEDNGTKTISFLINGGARSDKTVRR